MIIKFLIIAGTVIGALMLLRVFGKAADANISRGEDEARSAARDKLKHEEFVQCDSCGAYKLHGDPCACNESN